MKSSVIFAIALSLVATIGLHAKKTHSFRSEVWTPEEELAGFEVPEGFVVELVASEKDGIVNPIDLAFDDAGRLWTQTAIMYPMDPYEDIKWNDLLALMEDPEAQKKYPAYPRALDLYEGKTKGEDKILVIDSPWAKKPSKPKVWADGLAIPQSILPYKNGAYVAHGSELFFLNDSDGDGSADEKKRLLTNFGITDTHTMAHLLIRSPGDWIHFSHGALNRGEVKSLISGATTRIDFSKIARMSLNGAQLNVISSGLNNIWGFQLRANGQYYGTEANDKSWSIVPMEPGTGFQGIGNERIRPYQPWIPQLHDFRVGGTGISGLEFADGMANSFPPEWKDVALLANCITSTINAVRIVRNPDGTVTAEHLPDFLKSRDDWFRPVNMEFGPDGCLYVADWYNKIISHNELPRNHPERDKNHGRIWRIRHESQTPAKVPNLYEASTKDLVTHLKGPSLWEKRAAWHQITDRGAEELVPQLVRLVSDNREDIITRIHGLWSLEGLRHFDTRLMDSLTLSPDGDLRREAIRSLASFDISPSQMAGYLKDVIGDSNVMVRSQALRTLADFGQANRETIDILVRFCRQEIPGDAMGGPYERKFERFLARMALEQYESELVDYLDSSLSKNQPADNRFWAIQALSPKNHQKYFLALFDSINRKPWDTSTFIEIVNSLDNPAIEKVVAPHFQNLWNARHLAAKANEVISQVDSQSLKPLLVPAVDYLLASADQTDQEIGLEAVSSYRIAGFEEPIIQLLNNPDSRPSVLNRAITAIQIEPSKQALDTLDQIFKKTSHDFEIRLASVNAMVRKNGDADRQSLASFLHSLSDFQRDEFIKTFSASRPGSLTLVSLLEDGTLSEDQIDTWNLGRIINNRVNSQRLTDLFEKRESEKQAQYQKTYDTFMDIAESEAGDPLQGKPLFNAICLSCHSVGSEGAGWAPALDGSGYRDNEALLTAILDPSAASEGAYRVRRIQKTDGTFVEGYVEKENERGVTFRFMGGGSVFVPKSEIKGLTQVLPQSTMPEGLIDKMPHDQVANLLAYISTLQ